MVFSDIMDKIDKAARNGTTLHLPVALVRALATSPAYATLASLKAKEFAALWADQSEGRPRAASKSVNSGSTTEPIEMTGAYAGTTLPLVHAAAERRALEAARLVIHPRKHARL